jgi:hypothetical protein
MDYIILETQDQCHYFVEELEDGDVTCDLNLPNHIKSIIMTKWWIPTSIGRKNHKEKKKTKEFEQKRQELQKNKERRALKKATEKTTKQKATKLEKAC